MTGKARQQVPAERLSEGSDIFPYLHVFDFMFYLNAKYKICNDLSNQGLRHEFITFAQNQPADISLYKRRLKMPYYYAERI